MKRVYTIVWLSLLLYGCSDPADSYRETGPKGEETVHVSFGLQTVQEVDTDWQEKEMAEAVTAYKSWISNEYKYVLLKKSGARWIVDRTGTSPLDKSLEYNPTLKLTDGLPENSLSLELTPGEYRMVAVLNPYAGSWHTPAVGTVAYDESDPSVKTPPLATYLLSDHPNNTGYLVIYNEIFVAAHNFVVPKTEDLHSTGMEPIQLTAERRVGRFRLLLKDKKSPQKKYTFNDTAHKARLVFTPHGRPFPDGIDLMGNMYYDPDKPLNELGWCMYTTNDFHLSRGNLYQICQTNASTFAPFLFADPDAGDLPFTVAVTSISGASGQGGYSYRCLDTFERTLAVDKTTGIVFQTTDSSDGDEYHPTVDIVEATDAEGKPENPAELFDSYFEWNAESDSYKP